MGKEFYKFSTHNLITEPTKIMKGFIVFLTISFILIFSNFASSCDDLTLTYSISCASEGDVVDVTWTSTGCDATYEINISLLSLVPFATVQSMNNNVNDGSEMFTIGDHPAGDYQFYIQVSSGQGTCPGAGWYTYGPVFEIKVAAPVNFGEFSGELRDDTSLLFWETHAEINNEGFEIQHSNDIKNWNPIGFLEGTGNSTNVNSYEFRHDEPQNGINFYRLKQMDFNGTYAYSDIITLRYEGDQKLNDLTLFPNPSLDEIRIFTAYEKENYRIISSSGKVVLRGKTNNNRIDISTLESGMYYLSLNDNKSIQSFLKL